MPRTERRATADLTGEEIGFFRRQLIERRAELLEEALETVHAMGGEQTDAEAFPDPTDRGSLESDRNLELRMRDRDRRLLPKLEGAIERIDEGHFGICEECRKAIGFARLKVRPVTTLCIHCKEAQELREHTPGA
jgi:DnaK suppressor protein